MTPEQRHEAAKRAARARWGKPVSVTARAGIGDRVWTLTEIAGLLDRASH
jgi:hypothetical protein